MKNPSNCWKLPWGQSAAKTGNGKVQRLVERRTSKWMEMGGNQKLLVDDIV